MVRRGEHTFREICGQAKAWALALDEVLPVLPWIKQRWPRQNVAEVLFCGCGSTYYLSLTAAAVFQSETGGRARALPSSEIFLFPHFTLLHGDSLLVAVSRSGETTETVRAASVFAKHKGKDRLFAITCNGNSTLAALSQGSLVASAAQEKSYAQTSSFSSMLLLALNLISELAGQTDSTRALRTLPERGEQVISESEGIMRDISQSDKYQRFFFLGSGLNYGLACEGMLKIKEMSLSYSEAYHFLEFRHGPRSMVDEHSLVVGLLSDHAMDEEVAVLGEAQKLGAHVLVIGERPPQFAALKPEYAIWIESGLPEAFRCPLYLPPMQFLAYHRAMYKGLNPDRPTNVEAVVYI